MTAFKDKVAAWIGVLAVVAFGAFAIFLLRHVAEDELQWNRMVFIFGAVQAAGLAALGFFFGKEVNLTRADNAEDRANKTEVAAKKLAVEWATDRQNLVAIEAFLEAKASQGVHAGSPLLDRLSRFAAEHDARQAMPDLMGFIDQAKATDAVNPDVQEIAEFVQTLRRRSTSGLTGA